MSDLDLKENSSNRDQLDGGFAVVDRERVMEEETREVTPWYKHFIHLFTAPEKMMQECFNADPPKGASVGVVGTLVFMVLYMALCFVNLEYQEMIYNQFRMQGLSEASINSSFKISMISGIIGAVIGVFISCLFGAILLMIIKMILRDKGKFGAFYKVMLLGTTVAYAIQCIDALIGLALGQFTTIFSIAPILGVDMTVNSIWMVVANIVSLENLAYIVIIAIGYKVITHTNYKKAVLAVIIYEIITIAFKLSISAGTIALTQGLMGV